MDGWMDRWMDGWMDGWMDRTISNLMTYIVVIFSCFLGACWYFPVWLVVCCRTRLAQVSSAVAAECAIPILLPLSSA